MKKVALFLLCTALILSFCGCAKVSQREGFRIVATMFPQYDFAREIAGERAEIELLLDFGSDAHSYDPTPEDVMKIATADLFIYNGDDMELWVKKLLETEDIKKAIDCGDLVVLDLSAHVELLDMHSSHEHHEEHGHECEHDAHIWTSVGNARRMCEAITDVLCRIDPDGADYYRANKDRYKGELDLLSEEFAEVSSKARLKEAFFGGSFAFRYLFYEMGIEYHSVFEGCSSHAEATAKDIIGLSQKVSQSGALYVLYDMPSEKKIADAVSAEAGAGVLHLHAVHNISKEEFDSGENYISLMRKNVETLRKALS